MDEIRAREGWFVLHLFYRVDRACWKGRDPSERSKMRECFKQLIAGFREAENCQAYLYSVPGHKADMAVMLVDPELQHLNQMENDILEAFAPGILEPVYSFVSMSEISEYMSSEEDYDRTLREKEGLAPDSSEYQQKMENFRQKMQPYIHDRLYLKVPKHRVMCFYPMSKARGGQKNWYTLDFKTRKELMGGHLMSGRKYAGKVKQWVTGSAGLDDWEWGVTLFADDPQYLKQIVYEMRFDEVSAVYGQFGDFLVGIHLEPNELFERLKLG